MYGSRLGDKMNKKRANISVDPVVWENFRSMYPNSASEVVLK